MFAEYSLLCGILICVRFVNLISEDCSEESRRLMTMAMIYARTL